MIPGRALNRVARVLCSPAFCERVVEPLLADFQHESLEPRGFGQWLFTLARGYGAFWYTFALHALRAWMNEISGLTWRDAFPMPGILIVVTVGISVSHAWVTTGSVMNARFDEINTRNLWMMVPTFLLARWVPVLGGVRAFVIHAAVFAGGALLLESMIAWQPIMRGGAAFAAFCIVLVLVQKKNLVVEAAHRD